MELDLTNLNHILDAIQAIEGYTEGISFTEFADSSEKTFATIKQFEIIGEAANRITDGTRGLDPDIELPDSERLSLLPLTV